MSWIYWHATIVLVVFIIVFVIARKLKQTVELSMFFAALAGLLIHGFILPPRSPLNEKFNWFEFPRHIVEGMFTYFDVVLIFLTSTLFMNLYKEAGGVSYLIRGIIKLFYKSRFATLFFLALILLVPGALTGSGTVTVLVVGPLVAKILTLMGITSERVAAILFLCAAMSAAAPPINLWAMMTAAGSNMPYVGFFLPLGVLSILGALFSMFYLGWKGKAVTLDKALEEIPAPSPHMKLWKAMLPFLLVFGLILAGRLWPWSFPVLGLPLVFSLAGLIVWFLFYRQIDLWGVACRTVEELLPLIGIMTVVGVIVQVAAVSGGRGLISLSVVTLPLPVIFAILFIILPISEGLIQYAVAPLLGVPLILLFNMRGLNPIIALAGMATMWPLGDMLPPTAVVGKAAVMTAGYSGMYWRFVRRTFVPTVFILAICTAFIVLSNQLRWLARG